jgi:hypothetical protein
MPPDELVSIAEIAARLRVERQTVDVWRSTRHLLPPPDLDECPTCGEPKPLWRWETIERWAKATGHPRRPGRLS